MPATTGSSSDLTPDPAAAGQPANPRTTEGDLVFLGAEEEFHVVDVGTRELVPAAATLLAELPEQGYSHELQRSVIESNTAVRDTLEGLRDELVRTRRSLARVAAAKGLAVVAAGTVPLVDVEQLSITPGARYERMLDDYQLLVREQLICGAQIHVQVSDRDVAVMLAQRVTPYLPVLLALSASSPFWMGEDTGYASSRSLLWQRWPTAGLSGEISSAAEHDALVADLVASETISDPGMIYFDVRPSSHLPTLELRVTDACPDVDTVTLIAGLFRALVRHEHGRLSDGAPMERRPVPLLRSALWRASRSGLEGDLLDLPASPRPMGAALVVTQLVDRLRPELEDAGDWETVVGLVERLLSRGSSAAVQRAAFARRERFADVVDLLVEQTDPDQRVGAVVEPPGARERLVMYRGERDEALADGQPRPSYWGLLNVFERLGPQALRQRARARDEEQRSRGVTFGVPGRSSGRLFPVDLLPRRVEADDWSDLVVGLKQRARALDLFLHDVYGERAIVRDGVLPEWLLESAPGFNGVGALLSGQRVRANVCGMDLVQDAERGWFVLEDNLRVPSGLGYAVQNRRLLDTVMPDLPRPPGLIDVDTAPALLYRALRDAALPGAGDDPRVVLLSEGPQGPAWFEHRMLGEEMGVPVALVGDLLVEDDVVHLVREGSRRRVDVLYLRVDEDALLHGGGADGRPIGTGLLAAAAAGNVALANAPGNGVADDKAVYGSVPAMIEYYLGEKPHLAAVDTYLCGVPEQRQEVLRRLGDLVVKPVDGYGGEGVLIGPLADERSIERTRRQILSAPHRWIAQEMVGLTTHPCFEEDAGRDGSGRLEPRHVDLRAFVFHGEEIVVAPAALTRVAPPGSMVVNSSRGGGSKDTWLIA